MTSRTLTCQPTTMHLILSTGTPWNATYCNEAGQALYKAESPCFGFKLAGRTIQIYRVVPPVVNNWKLKEFDADSETLVGDAGLRDHYEHVAEVDYHFFKNSRIKYRSVDRSVSEIFRQGGFGLYGRNRIFTGPDGREYVWKLAMTVCKLFLNDASNTPVAVFHRRRLGIFREGRPASLEIFPEGQNMIEWIVISFIYVEKLRDDREKSSRSPGGGP